MPKRQYKFSFYLNSYHSMSINSESNLLIHPHTWQLVLTLHKKTEDFILFNDIEDKIQLYISSYEGKVLNDLPPFNTFKPSTENIGEVIFSDISSFLNADEWALISLEISENSTRTYMIENKNDTYDTYDSNYNLENFTIKPLTIEANTNNVTISVEDEFKNENLNDFIVEPTKMQTRMHRKNKKKIHFFSKKKIYQKFQKLISK